MKVAHDTARALRYARDNCPHWEDGPGTDSNPANIFRDPPAACCLHLDEKKREHNRARKAAKGE